MNLVPTLLFAALALGQPEATIRFIDGPPITGEIVSIDSDGVVVETAGKSAAFPLDRVLGIRFGDAGIQANLTSAIAAATRSGDIVRGNQLVTDDRTVTMQLPSAEKVEFPVTALAGVLFAADQRDLFDEWLRQVRLDRKSDGLIAVRNGEKLELDGIVGPISPENVRFSLDGDSISVKRDRVRALFFAGTNEAMNQAVSVLDRYGNTWTANEIGWKDATLLLTGSAVGDRALPADALIQIDFSPGRIVYLSDLEPAIVEHVPYFDVAWPYKRDENFNKGPIQLGDDVYPKGLVLHSKTSIAYNTDGQYRRFLSIIGIERSAGTTGNVVVQIIGDGKTLWESTIQASSGAIPLDIQIDGIKRLTIAVHYGELADLGDHVAFGDARLVR